ncbi:uncharacterized protein BCR38DRAFT_517250 [Pseudomassariella vexata]|uniref:FAD-binding PCMH-type domain-containing protein n=1 Tax=Pseudomassariella vexata TaxID=1141098 RepID=A0A1Y2DS29_9PEZI|nr:uncharacterized protein BCR38DRAFT_517250 [Pseudomassariella vexata]ORY62063.1 hypothetical protein BCR38DRAFT_517250 [Pseudomassariella vexata]
MIDSGLLCSTRADPENKIITFGGGFTWKDIANKAWKYALASVGGVFYVTGVGGLSLGGDYGWFTLKHGLVCNNLPAAELVLADGGIVNMSESENSDLFLGSMKSFSVTTSFTLHSHKQQDVYTGFAVLPLGAISAVADFNNPLPPQASGL